MVLDLAQGALVADHAHGWGQLLRVADGVARVRTTRAAWVLPRGRALWVPPTVTAQLHCVTDLRLRMLYFAPDALPALPGDCSVLTLPPLLQELVARAVELAPLDEGAEGPSQRVLAVLRDELAAAPRGPLALALPPAGPARALALRIWEDPGSRTSIEELCGELGVVRRTMERHVRASTGVPLGAWRRQARLLRAVEELGRAATVRSAARIAGYDSVSAFVFAFRTAFGTTPARWRDEAR